MNENVKFGRIVLIGENEDEPWIKLDFNVNGMLNWNNVENFKIVRIGYMPLLNDGE